jgi:hypothetical protein
MLRILLEPEPAPCASQVAASRISSEITFSSPNVLNTHRPSPQRSADPATHLGHLEGTHGEVFPHSGCAKRPSACCWACVRGLEHAFWRREAPHSPPAAHKHLSRPRQDGQCVVCVLGGRLGAMGACVLASGSSPTMVLSPLSTRTRCGPHVKPCSEPDTRTTATAKGSTCAP